MELNSETANDAVGHALKVISASCAILAGCSAVILGVDLVYMSVAMIVDPMGLPPPPTFALAGVLGILASMAIWVGSHLVARRELPSP